MKTELDNISLHPDALGDRQAHDTRQQIELPEAIASPVGQLTRIEAALMRLEAGQYGYCTACGEEIQIIRLEIDPAAPRCQACSK